MRTDGWCRGSFHWWLDSERRIGFGPLEGWVVRIAILCAAILREPMQFAEVMPFDGLGEVSEELEELSGRFGGQLERDADDRQVIWLHRGGPQAFFGFLSALDFALRAARSCASLSR